jgi:hypothetical protein
VEGAGKGDACGGAYGWAEGAAKGDAGGAPKGGADAPAGADKTFDVKPGGEGDGVGDAEGEVARSSPEAWPPAPMGTVEGLLVNVAWGEGDVCGEGDGRVGDCVAPT